MAASYDAIISSYFQLASRSGLASYPTPTYNAQSYYNSVLSAYSLTGFTIGPVPTDPSSLDVYLTSLLSAQNSYASSLISATYNPLYSSLLSPKATPTRGVAGNTATSTAIYRSPKASKASKAWIAGAVIGPLVGLLLILGAIAFAYHRGQRARKIRESVIIAAGSASEKPPVQGYDGPAQAELGEGVAAHGYYKQPQTTETSELSSVQQQPTGTSTGLVSELSSQGTGQQGVVHAHQPVAPVYHGPPVELPGNQMPR
ncbi:MAG: hypothetical protein M1814_006831 [Vezdaea aestivalis]|nr:MAG: hypothetical protein M1814_006831 [Vezdaea aestivalis]